MSISSRLFCLLSIVCCVVPSLTGTGDSENLERLNREKRTVLLLYGPFGVLQLILGFGVPVADLVSPAITLGYFMRGVYAVPKNASEYTTPELTELTRTMPITRWDIYQALEKDSEIRGHGGRQCVLRAICEAAEIPLDSYHGFFEEIFHTIFTPTSTDEPIREHSDNEYLAAHHLGANDRGQCKYLFPDCQFTFLDLFTQLFRVFDND